MAASWSDEELLGEVRSYVAEHLGEPGAVLVLDGAQAQKKGTKSVGVAHQHRGVTGDVRNCQVMVMLTYAAPGGHTYLDRRLPQVWTGDPIRCAEAGVPPEVVFATKPQLAAQMVRRAVAERVSFAWAVADSGYGCDPGLRELLIRRSTHKEQPPGAGSTSSTPTSSCMPPSALRPPMRSLKLG